MLGESIGQRLGSQAPGTVGGKGCSGSTMVPPPNNGCARLGAECIADDSYLLQTSLHARVSGHTACATHPTCVQATQLDTGWTSTLSRMREDARQSQFDEHTGLEPIAVSAKPFFIRTPQFALVVLSNHGHRTAATCRSPRFCPSQAVARPFPFPRPGPSPHGPPTARACDACRPTQNP